MAGSTIRKTSHTYSLAGRFKNLFNAYFLLSYALLSAQIFETQSWMQASGEAVPVELDIKRAAISTANCSKT